MIRFYTTIGGTMRNVIRFLIAWIHDDIHAVDTQARVYTCTYEEMLQCAKRQISAEARKGDKK